MGALDRVAHWPVDTAAAGVTDPARTLGSCGPADRAFSLASVTKPLAASGVLVAVDRGVVDLDQPAGPDGATLRHLLAHASGLPPEGLERVSAVGRRRIYSNTGFEVLGEVVGDAVGRPFAEFLRQEVLLPLEMLDTHLLGSPAHAAEGSLDDLLRFARELLAPTLIGTDLHREATSVVFEGLNGVLPGFGRQQPNDWGLGFEIRDHKDPHWTGSRNSPATFGHFGQSGTFLWVDPEAELACVALTDREFGPWAADAWPALSDDVLDAWGAR